MRRQPLPGPAASRKIYPHVMSLNPVAQKHWDYTPSVRLIEQLLSGRMFPLTLAGLDSAMRELSR